MEERKLRTMALESLNDFNPSFIKELFNKRNNANRRKMTL